jgi:hypothetical protein
MERKIETRIETHVNRTGKWVRVHQRGGEEPEKVRLQREVTALLAKRQTRLADALDALTALMLNVLGKRYGENDEFDKLAFRFSDEVSSFLEPTERDLPVGRLIPVGGPRGWPMKARRFLQRLLAAKAQPKPVTIEDRPERIRHLAIEVGQTMNNLAPSDLRVGLNALTGTLLTAIEATCGRERADEFDILVAGFSKESTRLSGSGGERVQ